MNRGRGENFYGFNRNRTVNHSSGVAEIERRITNIERDITKMIFRIQVLMVASNGTKCACRNPPLPRYRPRFKKEAIKRYEQEQTLEEQKTDTEITERNGQDLNQQLEKWNQEELEQDDNPNDARGAS